MPKSNYKVQKFSTFKPWQSSFPTQYGKIGLLWVIYLKFCCTFHGPLAVMSFHDVTWWHHAMTPYDVMTSHDRSPFCAMAHNAGLWCTTQVSGAQQTLVPLVPHGAQHRLVVHNNILLWPQSGLTNTHLVTWERYNYVHTVQNYVVHHQPATGVCPVDSRNHWRYQTCAFVYKMSDLRRLLPVPYKSIEMSKNETVMIA